MNRACDGERHGGTRCPRLWVPGLAFVTPPGDLHVGPSAGYSSREPAFQSLRCGYRSQLAYWTHVAWLVARSALDAGTVARHAIVLPESLVDRDALPHAHRWLREQPLVCVSGASWEQLPRAGVRVYRVAFDATGDSVLRIEATGGTTGVSSLTVALEALEQAAIVADAGTDLVDRQGDPSTIDRALRLVSAGVLDESSVLNAFDARCLIEDGYGYRGAPEGHFTTMDSVACHLRPLDVLFGQIFERARTVRPAAERLLAALADATPDTSELSLPPGEVAARRLIIPALHVPQVDELTLHGDTVSDLELAEERRWCVDGVDLWSPQLGAVRGSPVK